MALEPCRSSFSGAVSDCYRFSATSSVKEFYGYGTLSSFSGAVSNCCRLSATSSVKDFYGYGTLSSFSGALSDCCRLSATSSVKDFYGYGTLNSFSGAGTTGIYNTDFENKNYVWENGVFCLSFVLVNNWKADSYRVIKLIQAETIFKSACNFLRSLLENKKTILRMNRKNLLE